MEKEGRSKVWDYYTKDPSGDVVCSICSSSVGQGSEKSKSKNTTNLWHHLKKKHKDDYEVAQSQGKKGTGTQMTLPQVVEQTAKWGPNDQKVRELDKLIMEMIATDILPYAVVEGVGFKRLVAKLEQRYSLKNEKYFCTKLMEETYQKVVNKVKQLLHTDNSGLLAFTTDCWSGAGEALMSLTAHFIDKNWQRIQLVLNVKTMFGSHTGEYISETFLNLLKEWDIDHERVHLVLRDNGANMVKGMRLAEMPGLSCTAHTLQLVINDGLSAQRAVGDMLAKFKRIATHFNHSTVAQQRLTSIQKEMGVPVHSIIQSVPTRWNSVLHMIERMIEQKRAITAYSSDHGHFLCPTPNEWDLAGKLVETLKPLEEVTLELSKAESSASCILPSIGVLKSVLQAEGPHTAGIQTARKAMIQSLEDRFINLNQTKEVVLACLLDPRYKHRPLDQETLSQAKSWLQEEMQSQTSEETKLATITEEEKDPKIRRVGTESIVDCLFENMLAASTSEEEQPDDVLEELERYMREAVIDRKKSCPLEWWRNNSSRFKRLAKFAQK